MFRKAETEKRPRHLCRGLSLRSRYAPCSRSPGFCPAIARAAFPICMSPPDTVTPFRKLSIQRTGPLLAAISPIYGIVTMKGHRLLTSQCVCEKRCSSRTFPRDCYTARVNTDVEILLAWIGRRTRCCPVSSGWSHTLIGEGCHADSGQYQCALGR